MLSWGREKGVKLLPKNELQHGPLPDGPRSQMLPFLHACFPDNATYIIILAGVCLPCQDHINITH